MLGILRIGLKRVLGNLKTSVGINLISAILRAGLTEIELKSSEFGSKIIAWEIRNSPFLIVSD